jgi:hypothetical protein
LKNPTATEARAPLLGGLGTLAVQNSDFLIQVLRCQGIGDELWKMTWHFFKPTAWQNKLQWKHQNPDGTS